MWKMMIVDDEYIVRQGLRRTIPWEEMDVSIVGEAENVPEAVELARNVLPDIVLCDIRLPGGEGFLVIDEVRRIVPWVQFIMLSAHSDKKFMREAIYKGVCDYLFKPARVEDIREAVARAGMKVTQYQQRMKKDMKYQKFITENMDVLREDFLESLVLGRISVQKAVQDAPSLKIVLDGPCWRFLLFEVRQEDYYSVIQQLSFSLEAQHPSVGRLHAGKQVVALLNCEERMSDREILERIDGLPILHVQLSQLCSDLSQIPNVCRKLSAEKEQQQRDKNTEELDRDLREKKKMLFDAVKYHDSVSELLRLFDIFLEEGKRKGLSAGKIQEEADSIMSTVCVLTGVTGESWNNGLENMDVRGRFEKLCEEIRQSQHYHLDDISGKVLYYIRKQHREDLTLEQIAADLFMSSSYLSRILKERTGHGFGHWLNYYRIEEAKEKLKDPSMTIEQIADECGYNSYRIFSENFRKYTGKTASVWRAEGGS